MTRDSFDQYDEIPEDMLMYLRYNGKHFNRKLVEYAVSKMTTKDSSGNEVPLVPITKSQLDNMMNQYGVVLNNKDDVYDVHLCLYVKDVIDDIDGYEGIVFNRWYADMSHKGIPIDWYNYR